MASIIKRGKSWFAQIRRKGHESISQTFTTKGSASEWARKIERQMNLLEFKDTRSLGSITLGQLIDRYKQEIGGA